MDNARPMLDQLFLLEPLLRLMPLPPSLVRHAPLSVQRKLRSVRLSESPFVQGLQAKFDDTCLLSFGEGMDVAQLPIKLTVHGGRRQFSGVHLTVLSTKGQISLLLGDDNAKVFIGSETNVRAQIHLFRRPTVFIGDNTVIGQSRLMVHHADLVVGEDCHLIEDVLVQCNDPHPITDLTTGALISGERCRTYLGRHVLVQRRATLLPGVRIGDGSIVQAGALVSVDVLPNTMVGGAPASVLREQVAWERNFSKTSGSAKHSTEA
jgi:acetyltransferase-like isoleucine patch superfamily enzyme